MKADSTDLNLIVDSLRAEQAIVPPEGTKRSASSRVSVELVPAGRPLVEEFVVKSPFVTVMIAFGEHTAWEALGTKPLVKRHFRNRFHFIPADIELNVRVQEETPEFVIFFINQTFASSIMRELSGTEQLRPPAIGNSQALLLSLGKAIRMQMLAHRGLKALQLESFATLCLAEWSKGCVGETTPSIHPKTLTRIKDYVQERLDQDLTLADLAAIAELSPSYFLKSFKETTGQTPHRYLTERRIERARDRLERTNRPIAEIAYEAGFASQSHMTDVFRMHLNITPGRYRKMSLS